MTTDPGCPFCDRVALGDVHETLRAAVSFPDNYPVSLGHTLIVPKRHEPNLFDLTGQERLDMWELVDVVQHRLDTDLRPDGFNIGVNVGEAAGQTVGHAHIHVIPRFDGDVEDPRGGIRWIIPSRANYWDRS